MIIWAYNVMQWVLLFRRHFKGTVLWKETITLSNEVFLVTIAFFAICIHKYCSNEIIIVSFPWIRRSGSVIQLRGQNQASVVSDSFSIKSGTLSKVPSSSFFFCTYTEVLDASPAVHYLLPAGSGSRVQLSSCSIIKLHWWLFWQKWRQGYCGILPQLQVSSSFAW